MNQHITGNFSYRLTWRKKLVLVVEYFNEYDVTDDTPKNVQTKCKWRDALVSDLLQLARYGYQDEPQSKREALNDTI